MTSFGLVRVALIPTTSTVLIAALALARSLRHPAVVTVVLLLLDDVLLSFSHEIRVVAGSTVPVTCWLGAGALPSLGARPRRGAPERSDRSPRASRV